MLQSPNQRMILPRQPSPQRQVTPAPCSENEPQSNTQIISPGYRVMAAEQISKFQQSQLQALQLAQSTRPQVKGAPVVQSILGIRAQRMTTAQQQAVLRQASSPSKVRGTIQARQSMYLSHPPQTFMVTDNRQPVAMQAPQIRMTSPQSMGIGNRPMMYENPNGQDFARSPPTKPARTTVKRSTNIKAKLKSKIDRNKGITPRAVKKTPKMFDGDSLLAQLEDVT